MMNPVLLIAIPLFIAFLSISVKKYQKQLLVLAAVFNVVATLLMEKAEYIIGGFKPPFGINLVLDQYSLVATVAINLLFLLIIVMSYEKIEKQATVLLVALAGVNGMLLTGDLFNLFVFLEITSITAYILSSASKRYEHSFNYLVLGTIGSGLYLFGLILLYGVFGSLNMADISMKMMNYDTSQLLIPIFLIFTGLAVETKLLPFNGWVKGVYGHANQLTGALFAAVYAGTMLFVFGRVFGQVFVLSSYMVTVFIIIGCITLFAGEVAALSKSKIREILLFSSIGQSGLIVILFVSGLIFPAMLQILNNIISKTIMFTVGGKIADETGTDEKDALQGVFLKNKLIGLSFTIATLSLIGLPLFLGFYSKINLLLGLFSINNLWVPIVILVSTVIEGAYFIRLLLKLWLPGEEGMVADETLATTHQVKFESSKVIVTLVLSIIIILVGIYPALIQDNLIDDEPPAYLLDVKGGI